MTDTGKEITIGSIKAAVWDLRNGWFFEKFGEKNCIDIAERFNWLLERDQCSVQIETLDLDLDVVRMKLDEIVDIATGGNYEFDRLENARKIESIKDEIKRIREYLSCGKGGVFGDV